MPQISVITPSIRPDQLQVVKTSLISQTCQDFEWIPRLSLPRGHSDLCKQMNIALGEATGDIIVFYQDAIKIPPNAFELVLKNHEKKENVGYTYPVGKTLDWSDVRWDWRSYRKDQSEIESQEFEIDLASIPRESIGSLRFDEDYDKEGFGWENVQFALELELAHKTKFKVSQAFSGIAYDHDAVTKHPWKDKPNAGLWQIKGGAIRKLYEN